MTSKQPAAGAMQGEQGVFDARSPLVEPKALESSYENLQLEGKILN